ncbi:hypothetical protein GCM10022631_33350 [Deinococcus rubellus]|uniref:hypothetical protein n=1 Tax=Deinococcus rubellus TaxID=1889240 RepID=UPI0031F02DDE
MSKLFTEAAGLSVSRAMPLTVQWQFERLEVLLGGFQANPCAEFIDGLRVFQRPGSGAI